MRVLSNDAPTPPWWRQHWSLIFGGLVTAYGAGFLYAAWLSRSPNWNSGFAWERSFMTSIPRPLPAALDSVLYLVQWTSTNVVLIPIIVVAGALLWKLRDRSDLAMRLFVVQLGSFLLNPALKATFDRLRPELFERRGWYGWSAYPSGHAICAVAVLTTIALMLHAERRWVWPYAIIVPMIALSLYSRLYLGVHWPTDVIGGALVGLVWLFVTVIAFRRPPATPEPSAHTGA
jgi:membrane-associated phospholipid phosphatase